MLTHTHSGVNAIRTRLQHRGVPREKFEVATIAGWGLRWASAYPHLAGTIFDLPTGAEWQRVEEAAIELLQRRAVRDVLRRSFSGVFVDEYQDCNRRQHQIVMALADVLPCRLLGDPLQGIFEFAGPTVQWEEDIVPSFERLADLTTPHRWLNANPALGEWISELRAKFIAGASIDMGAMPVTWSPLTPQNQLEVCRRAAGDTDQTVVALGKWESDCHDFASRTGGLFGSMETLDCKRLVDFMKALDRERTGYRQAIEFFRFACDCITGIETPLTPFVDRYKQGSVPRVDQLTTTRRVIQALNRVVEQPCARSLVDAARAIETYPGTRVFRRELWNEMKTTLLTFRRGGQASLAETAWYVRDRSRRNGRRSENHVVVAYAPSEGTGV